MDAQQILQQVKKSTKFGGLPSKRGCDGKAAADSNRTESTLLLGRLGKQHSHFATGIDEKHFNTVFFARNVHVFSV